MKKRSIALLLLFALLVTIPAYAADKRFVEYEPSLEFSGTTALCTVTIIGDNVTDPIYAKMTLKQGAAVVDSWTGSGTGILELRGTAAVSTGVTYTLIVNATVNGRVCPTATIQETNN